MLPDKAVDPIVDAIYRAYVEREATQGPREHLGASLIGHECERFLWLTFRWAEREQFEGRMLRLFETGQLEEARFVENLRAIGCEVHDTGPDGKQWKVSHLGGHFGGSMDGCATNIPGRGKTWAVLEFKTHSAKSFTKLQKDGVAKAKPMHLAQMQVYMGLTGMERALYLARNKDNDELYSEWLHFDKAQFDRLVERAERIVKATVPPTRCSDDPSWWQCKVCVFHAQCHGDQVPQVNCRTCANATPDLGGDKRWTCAQPGDSYPIPLAVQKTGCEGHRFIPVFLERTARAIDYVDGAVVYEHPDGRRFANGDGTNGTLSSHEIRVCKSKAVLGDAAAVKAQVRTAKVVA